MPDVNTVEGGRDRALLETLYSTGIRRSELCHLRISDIDARGVVWVRAGKGQRDRVVPIGPRALAWVEKYRWELRPQLVGADDDGTLFLTGYGEGYRQTHLGNVVKRYLKQAGIEAVGSCHLFRHAMATHMLENGADIRFIQAMLGHRDLNTTEIYTRVSIEKLREIHAATHPGRAARTEPADEHAALANALLAELDAEARGED